MLEIKKIKKIYKTVGFEQKALDEVSVNFRKCEFAAILGPSGSGKTTFLNIIGGLDSYDDGDLIINGTSTKKYGDRAWDSFRNHRVGFIFQNYNLITHQNILKNVELALTLSGCSKDERKKRAIDALKQVGLEDHIYKKPNQLSGGQMQRVAIARALINDPEIILADEPTGALDSDTSTQIMKILKGIAKNKLVIMVTHNPELANEYATRIINIKDGKIISDSNPYDGKIKMKETKENTFLKSKKTKMSFLTALCLSFNNLMTKKGRTMLIAMASSIGIIGIALILAVSTGFQNYVDSIQENTLTSYPLTILNEQADITGMLLSMKNKSEEKNDSDGIIEKQYITSMLSNFSKNDLKSLKKYIEDNYSQVEKDLSNIVYSYSIEPSIYTIDANKNLSKLNPSNMFNPMMSSSGIVNPYSSMTSIYTQIVDNIEDIEKDYDVLAGHWPSNYDEMIVVLSQPNAITDILVYSLGLRDTKELTSMLNSVMNGETIDIHNEPLKFTYEDLLNVDLRLIMPTDCYKYNSKYKIYENMMEDNKYMQKLYDDAQKLKIVGIVSLKEGATSSSLNAGVNYTSALIDHIIDYTSKSEIVQKQLENPEINVFTGKRFDSQKNKSDLNFNNLIKIDNKKLENAFGKKIDPKVVEAKVKNRLNEISESVKTDSNLSKNKFKEVLNEFASGLFEYAGSSFSRDDVDNIIDDYLKQNANTLNAMSKQYDITDGSLKTVYSGLLKGLMTSYIIAYDAYLNTLDESDYLVIEIIPEIKSEVISKYLESSAVDTIIKSMGITLSSLKMRKSIIEKISNLTDDVSSYIATIFKVDQKKIASAFKLNVSEGELSRIITAIMNTSETNQKSNLISLGYQDKEDPTYILLYFTSFDGKEHFISFLNDYNDKAEAEQKINYTDTTGILMSSVKTIVNAVSYVLIAFVSISLVVSSIMIGVITYISVYERTKEIGILRAIGASKTNISSIFNAETFIIGLLSGLFGITVTYTLIPIINAVLHQFTGDIPLYAELAIKNAILLIILAIVLTIIGGLIPAKSASKKDPVEALRSE